eukprot:5262-Heterococcus_DN1.PRE.3
MSNGCTACTLACIDIDDTCMHIACCCYALQVQVDADDVGYVNELDDDDVTGDNDIDDDTDDIEQSELQIRSTILRKMYEAEALNINEAAALLQLLQRPLPGSAQLAAAFDVFDHTDGTDLEDLLDTLQRIAKHAGAEADADDDNNDDDQVQADEQEDDEDDYEEDFYADEDDGDNASQQQQQDDSAAATTDTAAANDADDDVNGDGVAEDGHFMHAIAQMGFSDVETAALRLCVARSDPMIRFSKVCVALSQRCAFCLNCAAVHTCAGTLLHGPAVALCSIAGCCSGLIHLYA